MKIIWLKVAETHLESVYDFLANVGHQAANKLYHQILDAVDNLLVFPEMTQRKAFLNNEYRALIVNRQYKIVYRIHIDTKEIVFVMFGIAEQNLTS